MFFPCLLAFYFINNIRPSVKAAGLLLRGRSAGAEKEEKGGEGRRVNAKLLLFILFQLGGGVFSLMWQLSLRLLSSFFSLLITSFFTAIPLIYRPLRRCSLFSFFYTSHHFFTALIPPLIAGCKRVKKRR